MLANRIGWNDTSSVIVSWTKSRRAGEEPRCDQQRRPARRSRRCAAIRTAATPAGSAAAGRSAACSRRPEPAGSPPTSRLSRPRWTRTAHQTTAASSSGSVQAWSSWVSVPGARSEQRGDRRPRSRPRAAIRPRPGLAGRARSVTGRAVWRASSQTPTTPDQRPGGQGPADVAEQPAPGREQHRRPREVGERVLDARRPDPGHGVEVLAAGHAVAAACCSVTQTSIRGRGEETTAVAAHGGIREDRGGAGDPRGAGVPRAAAGPAGGRHIRGGPPRAAWWPPPGRWERGS